MAKLMLPITRCVNQCTEKTKQEQNRNKTQRVYEKCTFECVLFSTIYENKVAVPVKTILQRGSKYESHESTQNYRPHNRPGKMVCL